jgi:hypothetical protein
VCERLQFPQDFDLRFSWHRHLPSSPPSFRFIRCNKLKGENTGWPAYTFGGVWNRNQISVTQVCQGPSQPKDTENHGRDVSKTLIIRWYQAFPCLIIKPFDNQTWGRLWPYLDYHDQWHFLKPAQKDWFSADNQIKISTFKVIVTLDGSLTGSPQYDSTVSATEGLSMKPVSPKTKQSDGWISVNT